MLKKAHATAETETCRMYLSHHIEALEEDLKKAEQEESDEFEAMLCGMVKGVTSDAV